MSSALASALICPSCFSDWPDSNIIDTECPSCGHKSFGVRGTAWWFDRPEHIFADWKNRISAELEELALQVKDYQCAAQDKAQSPLRKKRLQLGAKLLHKKLETAREILQDFVDAESSIPVDMIHSSLSFRQRMFSYERNILRDWAWDTDENQAAIRSIRKVLRTSEFRRFACLGSGSSRLAIDMAQQLKVAHTICIDIHPLLLGIASQLHKGLEVDWIEESIAPKSIVDSFREWKLAMSPEQQNLNVDFLFADATIPPLRDASCDLVATPWFLDVIPRDVENVLREINRILEDGGTWLFHGTYFFNSRDPNARLSKEEFFDLAKVCGFSIEAQHEDRLNYLCSPLSCERRSENILSFTAKKVENVEVYAPQNALEDWLEDPTLPVPALKEFENLMMINKVHTEVLASVNGQFSIRDLAQAVSQQYGVPQNQSEVALTQFFAKIIEKRRLNQA